MRDDCAEPDLVGLDRHIQLSMIKRGWTVEGIREAYIFGEVSPAVDVTAGGAPAARFVHPTDGKSVVINKATGRVIHVGGAGFQY